MQKTENLEEISSVAGGAVEGAMAVDPETLTEEEQFRNAVREILNQYSKKTQMLSKSENLEEQKLRNSIRKYLTETKASDASLDTTWANVLRDLLNKIIPQMRISYTQLQTNMDERVGFQQKVLDTYKELFYQIDNPEEQELKEQEEQENNLSDTEKLKMIIKGENPDFFDDIKDGTEQTPTSSNSKKDKKTTVSQDSFEVGQVFAEDALRSSSGEVQRAYSSKISSPEDREKFKKTFFANLLSWFRIWDQNKPISSSSEEETEKNVEDLEQMTDSEPLEEEIEIEF